jgi:hypothetical protein
MKSVSIRRFPTQAAAVIREVEQTGEPVMVTRRGIPVVIISTDLHHAQVPALVDGSKAGDLLYAAVVDAVYGRPDAFPTRQSYLNSPDQDIAGWTITDDRAPGDVAIPTNRLVHIAEAAGIPDALPNLRELRKRKLLLTDADGGLRRPLRVGTQLTKTYIFALPKPQQG